MAHQASPSSLIIGPTFLSDVYTINRDPAKPLQPS